MDPRVDEHEVTPSKGSLVGNLEEVLILPEDPLDEGIIPVVTAVVTHILPIKVLTVMVPKKERDPIWIRFLEREDFLEVLDGALRGNLMINDIKVVRVQIVPKKDEPLGREPLYGLLPEGPSMDVRYDNDLHCHCGLMICLFNLPLNDSLHLLEGHWTEIVVIDPHVILPRKEPLEAGIIQAGIKATFSRMDVAEKLPDIAVGPTIAEEWIVVEVDLLPVNLDKALVAHRREMNERLLFFHDDVVIS